MLDGAPPGPMLVVAAALIRADESVLVQQRPVGRSLAGLWEFPGGKVEPGETPEAALARELEEELGITVLPEELEPLSFASEPLGDGRLLLLLFAARRWAGEPRALHAAALRWVSVDELPELAMPAPDRPLVAVLRAVSALRNTRDRG